MTTANPADDELRDRVRRRLESRYPLLDQGVIGRLTDQETAQLERVRRVGAGGIAGPIDRQPGGSVASPVGLRQTSGQADASGSGDADLVD